MGEGKSWVEEKGQGSGAGACSEAVRGTIMITGHWWRTLKGWQPRHPPHNNVGSSSESHLVGPVCFASAACLHSIYYRVAHPGPFGGRAGCCAFGRRY